MKERIGLFGGSFDPVHRGHLALARRALEAVPLDRVLFIPAADSPFKRGRMKAGAEDRAEMLRLALEGEPRFQLSRADLDRGGVSYSIDLVRGMRQAFPDAELCFLVGADSLAGYPADTGLPEPRRSAPSRTSSPSDDHRYPR